MTDLLTRDPNDTGDIPLGVGEKTKRLDVGMRTQNLAPYIVGLPPALRRPDATGELPVLASNGCQRIELDEDDLLPPGQPKPPRPLPTPPAPAPKGEIVWAYADPSESYLGRHRKPSRWDWLTTPLEMAWQRMGRSV